MLKVRIEPESDLYAYESQTIIELVKHSEMISGVGFKGIPADWNREAIKRHIEQAEILCNAHRFVSPGLINSGLTARANGWYRTGVDGAFKGLIPEGEDVETFANNIERDITIGLEEYKEASEDVKAAFAREAHDQVICSHLFKSRNGRVARLLENHLRKLLGLCIVVIPYEASKEYYARIEAYRQSIFLPKLRKFYMQ